MKKLYFMVLLTSIISNVPASDNGFPAPIDNSNQNGNRTYRGQHFSWEKELVGKLCQRINETTGEWIKFLSSHVTSEIIKQKLSDEGIILDSTGKKKLFKRLNDRVRWNVDLENKAQLQQKYKKYRCKKAKFDNNPDLAWAHKINNINPLHNQDPEVQARAAAHKKKYN